MKTTIRSLTLVLALLILSGTVLAAAAAYNLDWYVLTGAGGGRSSSSSYGLEFTVGQTVIGAASSPGYRLALGYWGGLLGGAPPGPTFDLFLPILLRNH
jgi:hypothetical protein